MRAKNECKTNLQKIGLSLLKVGFTFVFALIYLKLVKCDKQ